MIIIINILDMSITLIIPKKKENNLLKFISSFRKELLLWQKNEHYVQKIL